MSLPSVLLAEVERVSTAGLNTIPTVGTIPASITKTGTITVAAGVLKPVIGVGTKFLTEVKEGDFLYAGGVLRKVAGIVNDTILNLEKAFPTTITAQAVKVPGPTRYRSIGVVNRGSVTAIYQEENFIANDAFAVSNDAGIEPVSYNASAGATMNLVFTLVK